MPAFSMWPDEHDAFLAECLAGGMSTAKAAAELNARFGTNYSRNACIGRASRRNMARDHAKGPKQRPGQEPAPPKTRKRRRYSVRSMSFEAPPGETTPPVEIASLRCVEIDPLHVSLLDLEPETCRWPYGEGPFTFCGHPAVFGSYCGPHFHLSIGGGTPSERADNRVSRRVA